MFKFYRKLAIRIRKLEPFLTIIVLSLFLGVILGYSLIPENLLFAIVLVMFWLFGFALVGHMFSPQTNKITNHSISKIKVFSGFIRGYGQVVVSVWFIALFFISIQLIMMYIG